MRLIDADELQKTFTEECCGCCDCCSHSMTGYKCELIDNAPTVEERIEYGTDGNPYTLSISNGSEYSRPAAKWIPSDNRWGLGTLRCSHCNIYYDTDPNYCPNCGAYMKGGKL